MLLKGKVAMITGAKEGIGKALAAEFAKEGADLVLVSRSIEQDSDVVKEAESFGRRVLAAKADVANRQQVAEAVQAAIGEFGHIDALVNNAGLIRPAMLLKMKDEDWDMVINVHLKGTFICTQEVAKHMAEQKSGSIINTTSSAGLVGTVGQVNYSAAKGGIVAFSKSAARELARYNITVNVISPFAETGMSKTIATDPRFREKYIERIPMGRFGRADEMSPAVVFLASEGARYITGQVLCIDGGMIM